jgi:hypothetical protein
MTAEMAGPGAAQRVVSVAPQSGQAVTVGRGEQVRVVDPGGRQVGDMWTIDAADGGRWLSASHTRDPLRAPVPWAEPGVGQPCRPCAAAHRSSRSGATRAAALATRLPPYRRLRARYPLIFP